jgi:hypothetical protein
MGRHIDPPRVAGNIEKVTVVDAVRIRIQEEPEVGRPRQRQVGSLGVNATARPALVSRGRLGRGVEPGILRVQDKIVRKIDLALFFA